jgi:hypothetical protein
VQEQFISQVAAAEAWASMDNLASAALAEAPMERELNQVEMRALHLQAAAVVDLASTTLTKLDHQKQLLTLQVARVVRV